MEEVEYGDVVISHYTMFLFQ